MNILPAVFVILLFATVNGVKVCKKSITTASGTHAPKQSTFCSGQIIFEDNFNKLDCSKWQHENTLAGGGNWEFQWYTNNRTNSYTENGVLKIKPTLTAEHLGEAALFAYNLDLNGGSPAEECTNPQWYGCQRTGTSTNIVNPIKSARIRTVNSFSFRYGRVQIRAKLPTGDWLWPVVLMLSRYNPYGTWPASGEIDILEGRGNPSFIVDDIQIGVQQVGSSLRWGPNFKYNGWSLTHASKNNASGYNTDFHIYEFIWTDTHITFKIDNTVTLTIKPPKGGFWDLARFNSTGYENPWAGGSIMAPFDEEFYLVMGLGVGGVNGYWPDTAINPGGKPWSDKSQKANGDFWYSKAAWLRTWRFKEEDLTFQIDYIRVYAA